MSRFIVLLLGAFLALTLAQEEDAESPIVQAPVGKIRGSIFKSRLGRNIYAYRSIRYAEPPVGQQRFQVATPAANWTDVYDGTQEGPACPTLSWTTISEDCLRLNVYTTKLPTQNAKGGHFKGRPVVVFFHPGGFYAFSGQSRFFGPEYIMDKDIVLVTVNNRMGTLGFLSTGDSLAPGNLGFKDQVVALRWVQQNIEAFGGDRNSVTISGYSVGSISVLLHMVSPMSKGLFHKAIAMSASPLQLRRLPTEQKAVAKKQAELLGCPTDTTGSMIICMNTKPVENFTDTMGKFFEYYTDPMMIWSPVVEPEVHGVERFLPAQPDDLIREGKINEVPLIIGTTIEEFTGLINSVLDKQFSQGNYTILDNLNQNWDTLAPISFMYERDTPRSKYISQELRQFYFKGQPVTLENYQKLGDIYTDAVIIFETRRVAQLFATYSRQPVYFYQFSYHGRFSFYVKNDSIPYGIAHHDDLQYLFYMKAVFPFLNETSPEVPMVERYTSMWTNFARTGEPIPKDQDIFKNVVWERFSKEKDNYLEINLQPTMKQGIFPERMQLWERLFPLPPLSHSVKGRERCSCGNSAITQSVSTSSSSARQYNDTNDIIETTERKTILRILRLIVLFFGVFLALTLAPKEEAESPIVQAPVGKIRGSIFKTIFGRTIYAYRSVRYAEPAVGQRRFEVATPAADWNDTYDGTQEGPACIILNPATISEDCLRLNIYTRKLPTRNVKDGHFKGRPVMVFFHPGGFYSFSGQSQFFGPEYIMDKNIVLVTLNHRMATLGFMSTGDSLAPGNLGLKDQVEALRWIQRNIAAFGGDPNSVTIFGYSVGSTSVLLHMVSPMSKGLFHKAIAMSGSSIQLRPLPTDQKVVAQKQAELLGCPTDTTVSMLTCMKTIPVENFTATMPRLFEDYADSALVWSPVVEPEVQGVERFLPAQPEELIKKGKINEVPLIIGTTIEEFNGILSEIDDQLSQGNLIVLDNLNKNWGTVAPYNFLYERGTPRSSCISQELGRFYFKGQQINIENYQALADIYSDSNVVFVVRRVAQLFATYSHQPVYFYLFSYHGRYSLAMRNDSATYGVVHNDDLQYLFCMKAILPILNATSPEILMVERYTSMWTNFALTGEPIPKDQEIFKNVVWERFSPEKDNYLDINLQPTMKQGIFPERMLLWERLFPLPSQLDSVTELNNVLKDP